MFHYYFYVKNFETFIQSNYLYEEKVSGIFVMAVVEVYYEIKWDDTDKIYEKLIFDVSFGNHEMVSNLLSGIIRSEFLKEIQNHHE